MVLLVDHKGIWRGLAASVLVTFLLMICPISPLVSAAQADVKDDLDQAIELYEFADYDEALAALDGLLASGSLSGDLLRDAHIYRARSLIGLGRDSQAQDAFCEAILLDDQWRPDPVFFSQDEIVVYDRASAGCTPVVEETEEKVAWYKKPIVWVAGGVVIIGGILLAGGGGDDEAQPDGPLGDYPDPPPTK